jgi:Domain of unknown function (DUF4169)
MSNLVNLNKFRKKKQRANKEQQAEENRVTFGRTKAEKRIAEKLRNDQDYHLDGHKPEDHDT